MSPGYNIKHFANHRLTGPLWGLSSIYVSRSREASMVLQKSLTRQLAKILLSLWTTIVFACFRSVLTRCIPLPCFCSIDIATQTMICDKADWRPCWHEAFPRRFSESISCLPHWSFASTASQHESAKQLTSDWCGADRSKPFFYSIFGQHHRAKDEFPRGCLQGSLFLSVSCWWCNHAFAPLATRCCGDGDWCGWVRFLILLRGTTWFSFNFIMIHNIWLN